MFIIHCPGSHRSFYKDTTSCNSIYNAVYICPTSRTPTRLKKRGLVSMYVLIGFVGFPIFTEGGGPTYLLKPTFGYLLAFILAAYIVGYAREKYSTKKFAPLFIACLIAMVITYGFGSFYTYIILNYVAGSPIPYWACIASLFPITAIKDIVGCLIASVACQRLSKFVEIDF